MDIIMLLNIVLVILVVIIIALAAAYFFIVYRNKNVQAERENKDSKKATATFNGIPKEEINKI